MHKVSSWCFGLWLRALLRCSCFIIHLEKIISSVSWKRNSTPQKQYNWSDFLLNQSFFAEQISGSCTLKKYTMVTGAFGSIWAHCIKVHGNAIHKYAIGQTVQIFLPPRANVAVLCWFEMCKQTEQCSDTPTQPEFIPLHSNHFWKWLTCSCLWSEFN